MAVAFGGSFRGGNVPPVISTSPALQIKKNVIVGSFLNRLFHRWCTLLAGLWMQARLRVTLLWYRHEQLDLQNKSRKVFINTRSPAASQIFNGLVSVKMVCWKSDDKRYKRKFLILKFLYENGFNLTRFEKEAKIKVIWIWLISFLFFIFIFCGI